MDADRKSEGRIKSRKKGSSGGREQIAAGAAEKSTLSGVKAGRVRKPKRGNRAGAGRRRRASFNDANGAPSVVSGGGPDSERRKPKKKGKLDDVRDASDDERLQQSLALFESKKSASKKPKSKSKGSKAKSEGEIPVLEQAELAMEVSHLGPKPVTFLDKARARLTGSRFRMLNESLYTCNGDEAFELFQQDPAAFDLYHTGYQEQMAKWPVLPVTAVTTWLKARSPNLVVADFGCGDARLAKSVPNKVFSLDLVSSDPAVIACNMAKTPLETSSIDVAVFCLSLMGTDYPKFIEEAHRVLKSRGWMVVAEVKSRLDAGNGGAGPQAFISALKSFGFALDSQDSSNKMFHMFYFQKEGYKHDAKRKINWPELKPCIYKRR
ncbi:ribosomal RNA-processing protein 8 [Marchantia polymorpha subsp. ruderalis]|uniref:Ribosomal RNA-processing protein 8 n=1 Tax=Marchantia polymorpha TaxID=3197 RepID=A0A2R6WVK7_MARPO|nr:hypothetical protein MARPO_0055s0119 [Marchantia polymorpha]BBN02922.1 hypothetical protein Mp_2g19330 [Marchantia polymorpha subsp. ruderalis]|eukprot:PTQ37870.1 hypothetical protein MARPO_0055s0119 [Marchantia polymorpha]